MKKSTVNIIAIISLLFYMGSVNSMIWTVDTDQGKSQLSEHASCENNSDDANLNEASRWCVKHCAAHVAIPLCDLCFHPPTHAGKVHTFVRDKSLSFPYKIILPPPKTSHS